MLDESILPHIFFFTILNIVFGLLSSIVNCFYQIIHMYWIVMYKQETGTRIVFEKKGDGVGEVTLPQLYIIYNIQSDKMVFCYFFSFMKF